MGVNAVDYPADEGGLAAGVLALVDELVLVF